jgi:polysaccharide pyruvyl transferase WcaK-like protein
LSEANKPSARQPHILLYGMFGIGNTGNDATLGVTLAELRKHLPDARFTAIASVPDWVRRKIGIDALPIRSEAASRLPGPLRKLGNEWTRWRQACAVVRDADCLLIPGTGILDDFGASVMGHAFQLWRWCMAARVERKPIMFISVGAGPVQKPWSRRLFRWAARAAAHRSYRDQASKDFARGVLLIDVSKDDVTPDLVFGLEHAAPPVSPSVEVVGVGVMNYRAWLGGQEDAYEPHMRKLTQFTFDMLRQGKAIRILVGDAGDLDAARDFEGRLKRSIPDRADKISRAETSSLIELCGEIAKTDVVVATRFHTIVGALMSGRPAVSIGYADKNKAVMQAFGMGAYCQDIWNYDLDLLHRQFTEVTADSANLSARLRVVAQDLAEKSRAHLARIAGEINQGF